MHLRKFASRSAAAASLAFALASAAMLTACAHRSEYSAGLAADLYERSTHALAQPPAAAAACVAKNASQAGYSASEQPLYGTTEMAVNVRAWSVGDVIASLSLLPRLTGSNATVTTMRQGPLRDRFKFVQELLTGC